MYKDTCEVVIGDDWYIRFIAGVFIGDVFGTHMFSGRLFISTMCLEVSLKTLQKKYNINGG